jgi:hypothetical protein
MNDERAVPPFIGVFGESIRSPRIRPEAFYEKMVTFATSIFNEP